MEEQEEINKPDNTENLFPTDRDRQLIEEIREFHIQLFGDSSESESLKSKILSFFEESKSKYQEISDTTEQVKKLHNGLFVDDEAGESLETKVWELHELLLEDSDERISLKTDFQNLLTNSKNEFAEVSKKASDIHDFHSELVEGSEDVKAIKDQIENFHDRLFSGVDDEASLESQFEEILEKFSNDQSRASKDIQKLETFYKQVYSDVKDPDTNEVIKLSLIKEIDVQKSRLQNLITRANEKLHALTDSSLHNAFADRAKAYATDFKKLQNRTFYITLAVVADILIFGVIQLVLSLTDRPFNYHLLIYQFSIAGVLAFAIWMYNRNQKIAKKLAEEYHHKASLAEAMTGYRELYKLKHTDTEYMELFNSLRDQLNTNPSKGINAFLNLKSPHEELSEKVSDNINVDKLKELLGLPPTPQ